MGLFGKSRKEKEAAYMARIDVEQCLKEDFVLTVEDVFTIVGMGTVVTGTVSKGMCRVGEAATVGGLETMISAIDVHIRERRPNDAAYATEHVGLGLRGVAKEQVRVGDVVKVRNAYKYQR